MGRRQCIKKDMLPVAMVILIVRKQEKETQRRADFSDTEQFLGRKMGKEKMKGTGHQKEKLSSAEQQYSFEKLLEIT